jgi:SAM-dependent methyltransferase
VDASHDQRPHRTSEDWDDLYKGDGEDRVWSGLPNGSLVAEVSTMEPGRAVDLGCGEGGDAIWLASLGWRVTGIDISRVALDRAAEAAGALGVTVDWVCADFVTEPPKAGAFDLVTTHYPALLKSEADRSIEALVRGVAPGGTLLFVGHEVTDTEAARSHGFDPEDYVQAPDVAERLGSNWTIEVQESRERASTPSERSPHSRDVVLRARRIR